jgi:predicted DNA-binding antitoxin AbrB/MazE fold protein
MITQVEAVYENGIFRPLKPVQLSEHQLVTITIAVKTPGSSGSETQSAGAADGRGSPLNNPRRIELINKETDTGLSAEEAAELNRLQAELDQALQRDNPLPWDKLHAIEDCAKREGLLNDSLDA